MIQVQHDRILVQFARAKCLGSCTSNVPEPQYGAKLSSLQEQNQHVVFVLLRVYPLRTARNSPKQHYESFKTLYLA